MVQQALAQSGSESSIDAKSLSASEINSQIHSTIQEAIKNQQQAQSENKANSKLGFLQQVVSLECFFGGSTCLFKDKDSMRAGRVTEFAKKRFEEGNHNVNQYLTQVSDNLKPHSFAQTADLVQTP